VLEVVVLASELSVDMLPRGFDTVDERLT
jgi:hypothetical protein